LGLPQHFNFTATDVPQLVVTQPASLAGAPGSIVDSFEVFNATVLPGMLPLVLGPSPRTGSLQGGLQLGVDGPDSPDCPAPAAAITRTLVFAADTSLRGELTAALGRLAALPPQ